MTWQASVSVADRVCTVTFLVCCINCCRNVDIMYLAKKCRILWFIGPIDKNCRILYFIGPIDKKCRISWFIGR